MKIVEHNVSIHELYHSFWDEECDPDTFVDNILFKKLWTIYDNKICNLGRKNQVNPSFKTALIFIFNIYLGTQKY